MAIAKEKERSSREKETRDKEPSREPKREGAIARTFREVRSEMRKVVWPTREETTRLTVVVISVAAVLSLILFVADEIFAALYLLLRSAVG